MNEQNPDRHPSEAELKASFLALMQAAVCLLNAARDGEVMADPRTGNALGDLEATVNELSHTDVVHVYTDYVSWGGDQSAAQPRASRFLRQARRYCEI